MRHARIAALGVAAALLLGACGEDPAGGATRLPDLTLAPLSAGDPSLELADLRGPAVVNLWATWCAPCRRELPAFQEVSETRPDVRFVGIDIGEDAAKAQDFIDELGISFDQFVDAERRADRRPRHGGAPRDARRRHRRDGGDRAPRPDDGRRPRRRHRGRAQPLTVISVSSGSARIASSVNAASRQSLSLKRWVWTSNSSDPRSPVSP